MLQVHGEIEKVSISKKGKRAVIIFREATAAKAASKAQYPPEAAIKKASVGKPDKEPSSDKKEKKEKKDKKDKKKKKKDSGGGADQAEARQAEAEAEAKVVEMM